MLLWYNNLYVHDYYLIELQVLMPVGLACRCIAGRTGTNERPQFGLL